MVNRSLVQTLSAALLNSNYKGFVDGTIYRGISKGACVPVLNCYSCPGAVGACPVGSLQAVAAGFSFQLSFYAVGLLALTGVFLGRFTCGWICPFGYIQDLLHRLPSPKLKLPGWMRYIKYFMLFIPVLILPALLTDSFGLGVPYFCKWLCPAGTLEAALPLYAAFPPIRTGLGWLFTWRVVWLAAVLIFIILVKRGFCQVFCPLGAFYSFFNRFSYYRLKVDHSRCTACQACKKTCFAGVNPAEQPDHPECVRCLDCVKSCPGGALSWEFCGLQKLKGC